MAITASEIRKLGDDLDRGLSLPAAWYYDPAISALEMERIFRRSWQYVGRAEQVAEIGDYFTANLGDVPVIVVRTETGVQALVNVCRHRRHLVASGDGHRAVFQCPYHSWTYELDGRLRAAPRSEREQSFCKDDYPLLPLQVATWGRWLFATLDRTPPPLVELLGELPQIIAKTGMDVDKLQFYRREAWARDANWKVMIENFLECYHCPVQHPGFSAVIDVRPDAYSLEAYRWHSSQTGSVRETPSRTTPPYDASGEVREAQYHFLWPNFTISINPGRPNLSVDVWLPDGPGRTHGFSEHYFGADVPADWAEDMLQFNAQVGQEDDRLTDSVQRGVRTGFPAQGRFLVNSEHLCIHFQRLVLSALA